MKYLLNVDNQNFQFPILLALVVLDPKAYIQKLLQFH